MTERMKMAATDDWPLACLALAVLAALWAYITLPIARSIALEVLCLLPLAGMFVIRPDQVIALCATAMAGLWLCVGLLWRSSDPAFSLLDDGLSGGMASVMLASVGFVVYQFSLKRERQQAQQQLLRDTLAQMQSVATKDPLTGLFNQRHMREWLQQASKRAQRAKQPLCLALLNLDRFRSYNEQHGHEAGDALLCQWTQRAQSAFRETDVMARWSGDELLVLFDDSTPDEALAGLSRLRSLMGEQRFSSAVVAWGDKEPMDAVLERLREALRQAKTAGRQQDVLAAQ